MSLPDEMWAMIFTYLDKVSLHKSATLVNKHWFDLIRNDQKLSGKIELSVKYLKKAFKLTPLPKSNRFNEKEITFCDPKLHSGLSKMFSGWPKLKKVTIIWSNFRNSEDEYISTEHNILLYFRTLNEFRQKWNVPFLKEVTVMRDEPSIYNTIQIRDILTVRQSSDIQVIKNITKFVTNRAIFIYFD